MSRAEDLYGRLAQGQLAALDQLIDDREPESLFLDFKRSSDNGAGVRLATDDNRNLSKAISGFANSAGGVVLWGVDCRPNPATGNEEATKMPLVDAAGFRTKLENAISRTTLPVHSSIEVLSIAEAPPDARGYVAVLVPQGTHGPVRSLVTNHYHLRAGSDFVIVPHDALAGMFGRHPLPRITPNVASRPVRFRGEQWVDLSLRIVAVNIGTVLCERPFLSIWFGNFPSEWVHPFAVQNDFEYRSSLLPGFSVTGRVDLAVPPGAAADMCDLTLEIPRGYARPFSLKCTMGCSGAEPERFAFSATEESLRLVNEPPAGNVVVNTTDVLVPDFPITS